MMAFLKDGTGDKEKGKGESLNREIFKMGNL